MQENKTTLNFNINFQDLIEETQDYIVDCLLNDGDFLENSAEILVKKITKEDFKDFMEKNKKGIIEELCEKLYDDLEDKINKEIKYQVNKKITDILEKTLKNSLINSLINSLNKKE